MIGVIGRDRFWEGLFTHRHRSKVVRQCVAVPYSNSKPSASNHRDTTHLRWWSTRRPGGSDQAICAPDQSSGHRDLVACGFAYRAHATIRICELAALRDGLTFARTLLRLGYAPADHRRQQPHARIQARALQELGATAPSPRWTNQQHRQSPGVDKLDAHQTCQHGNGPGMLTDQPMGSDKARFQRVLGL